jgi:nicotinate phosphoribosyltransferase
VRIVFSGGLDEYQIEKLVRDNVPVDAFGVGTSLDVSADAPSLDIVYKLQEYAGKPRRKRSPGKSTWPGAKQVYRERDPRSGALQDRIALIDEQLPGVPLLTRVMSEGRCTHAPRRLSAIRDECLQQLATLPPALRELEYRGGGVLIQVSDAVRALAARADAEIG